MDLKSIQKVVSGIQAALFKNSNTYSVGMFKSHFKGMGLQFKEHQVYAHGDDIRQLDWTMLAKTSNPYIKTFEEERNVEISMVVDASRSMFSGLNKISKLQAALEVCCLLYLLTEKTGDNVEVVIFLDEVVKIPKASGYMGISQLMAILSKKGLLNKKGNINLEYEHQKKITEGEIFSAMMGSLERKKEIILLSDFNEFISIEKLKKILYRSNIHCFQILSPLDESEKLPFLLYSSDRFDFSDGAPHRLALKKKRDLLSELGSKFKRLRVEDRYLEEFVKEML